jgi:lipopolysaccharide/colanic/teichoic acid biosynthesis glycosyltransferase
MLVYEPRDEKTGPEALERLIAILRRRIRLTDDLGWLDARRLAVVLSGTGGAGAWALADDVAASYGTSSLPPHLTVYSYPTESFNSEGEVITMRVGDPQHERPIRAMEPFFFRRMPAWKRAVDLLGAAVAMILFSPFFLVAAVLVKLTSPGPVFFRQRRAGLGGKPFTMYKFRTMVDGAERQQKMLLALNEQEGPVFKMRDDPRITPLGRVLRKTSIDELPQLWNVLRGEMSLVGPRPPLPGEVREYQSWQRQRLDVTPGLTCTWQVMGRSQIPFIQWVRMDVQYIRSRSLRQDISLLFRTLPAVVLRRGAT